MELIVLIVAVALLAVGRHIIYRSEPKHDGPRVYCVYPKEHRACIGCQQQGYCEASPEAQTRRLLRHRAGSSQD